MEVAAEARGHAMIATADTGNQHELDRRTRRDLRVLARFVEVFCNDQHNRDVRRPIVTKVCDLAQIAGHSPCLCPNCTRLLNHACVKRIHCPMQPKPACKDCPAHCYHPTYREQMREVMRYSGRKLVLSGRLDYLLHLLF